MNPETQFLYDSGEHNSSMIEIVQNLWRISILLSIKVQRMNIRRNVLRFFIFRYYCVLLDVIVLILDVNLTNFQVYM